MSEGREIPGTLDLDEMMWAGSAYVFWPLVWLALFMSPKKEVPFVRFHVYQALVFGGLSSFGFLVLTGIIYVVFRNAGAQSAAMGMFFVGLFGAWLFVFLVLFLLFCYYAYRAGRGDLVRVPFIGGLVEQWVLAQEPVGDAL